MILYLDSSALVKRYVTETGSAEVEQVIAEAAVVGTGLISRAEVSAAFSKGVRVGALTSELAMIALKAFRTDWEDLVRIQVSEAVVARADTLAWDHGLRGYDAIHLAMALVWQEIMGEHITLASFDRQLWAASGQVGLVPFPTDLDSLSEKTKK